ncbi:MAG: hypothetical protein U9O94_09185, partial [Nanoarchaeota archaeon]|nr:hypothetical protein [Nanoarchaeota archaeon]
FTDGLKQKWGDDFEGNFDKAKEFMADNLSKEEAKKLEGLDNVSLTLLTEVAISLRDKYQDNSSLPAGSDTGTSALANLVKERDEIMQSDIYRSGGLGRNSVAFATKQNELLALTDKIHKIKTGS